MMTAKCSCYSFNGWYGVCSGTRELDRCECNGDMTKCDFYPEKRKGNKMNTAEMWLKAQVDGKMYRSKDIAYSKETGFIDFWNKDKWPANCVKTIDETFSWDGWEEVKTMTKAEAEEKLGVKIVG